ncbi:unnamed protein product [Mytilus edulis]|uniref:Uncharacterized protein n=1 Tax=Mytilus edulis TaxID=6550 RepID=A0A8S3UQI4_MYTED|nr:unnamed protein product [Mytilus edulis]
MFDMPIDQGTILFENIYEDRYTVYAKAEDHSTYSAIIIATPYTTVRDIFLQRTAVTYTWTVTPTTVEDKYEITLDSTFETFVPMPVVTIEPNKLDTVPFETEERESVDFTITNHGLIRADNLRFYLPTGHPTLQFQSKCILAFLPWKSCIPSTGKLPTMTIARCALKGIVDIVEQWFKPTEQPKLLSEVNIVYNFSKMSLCTVQRMWNKRERRDVSSEVADNVLFTSKPMNNYIQMMEEIYEKEEMFNVSIEWYPAFKTVISDDSESGSKLSKEEKSFVLNTLRNNLSIPILNRFLERWNNTVSAWNNGTLYEVIRTGRFINLSSLSMMWQQYTRDTTTANERGDPNLLGLTGVDGDGRLGVDLSGSAEWLIIPYSIAAPNDDVLYNVGGRLSYRVGESNFSVPLLPDSITVKPNPSLVLHYFHEKYVRGDDPLTAEKEPVIPFTLAVMVKNSGYGVARALKISSAQPQIIENEKGLLITFRIIGGFLGNKPISPSLIVDFGDIKSFETKTARWMLTSTLQGTFYNFSATFENINPLGDPQLSLFENVWYHELIHLVRLFRDGQDDGFDDFW